MDNSGYISRQAHKEYIAVKDGEIDLLKETIKNLQKELKQTTPMKVK